MRQLRLTTQFWEWGVWVALFGILYALGRDHYHLKHTGIFMIVMGGLVVALLVAFALLERRKS